MAWCMVSWFVDRSFLLLLRPPLSSRFSPVSRVRRGPFAFQRERTGSEGNEEGSCLRIRHVPMVDGDAIVSRPRKSRPVDLCGHRITTFKVRVLWSPKWRFMCDRWRDSLFPRSPAVKPLWLAFFFQEATYWIARRWIKEILFTGTVVLPRRRDRRRDNLCSNGLWNEPLGPSSLVIVSTLGTSTRRSRETRGHFAVSLMLATKGEKV